MTPKWRPDANVRRHYLDSATSLDPARLAVFRDYLRKEYAGPFIHGMGSYEILQMAREYIRAERTPHYGASEQVIAAERPQEAFARQLSLGEGVDSENLTASYADGVLHVTIPASPKAQARRVEVTRAAGGRHVVPGSTVGPGEAAAGSTGGGAG
jgi:hypothetical protein